jgi:hypothetical protein
MGTPPQSILEGRGSGLSDGHFRGSLPPVEP